MLHNLKIQQTIIRVKKMEQILDEVLDVLNTSPNSIKEDVAIREKVQQLIQYYDGGEWLKDYECDERGELPIDLKRGVLAEDTLYNLFSDIKEIEDDKVM